MATEAKHRGNTPDPKVTKQLFESLLNVAERKKELSAEEQQIKIDASTDHNISTRSVNEVLRKVKKIMKTGQLEFNDFADEAEVLWEALKDSGFEIPDTSPDDPPPPETNVVDIEKDRGDGDGVVVL